MLTLATNRANIIKISFTKKAFQRNVRADKKLQNILGWDGFLPLSTYCSQFAVKRSLSVAFLITKSLFQQSHDTFQCIFWRLFFQTKRFNSSLRHA